MPPVTNTAPHGAHPSTPGGAFSSLVSNVKRKTISKGPAKPPRSVVFIQSTWDGELSGDCCDCNKSKAVPIDQYAPVEHLNNIRRRQKFFDALADYRRAWKEGDEEAAEEARSRVEALRHGRCASCAQKHNKGSTNMQACKNWWDNVRKEECARNDGCFNPDCVERGPEAWCVLNADHVHTRREKDEEKRKTKALSEYVWWSNHGGVNAMQKERSKGVNFLCSFCHMLEPTSGHANKYTDPKTMPAGKSKGTAEEVKQYLRKLLAEIIYPKQRFVDDRKLQIGECAHCRRAVRPGEERAFSFDHLDERTKLPSRKVGGKGGVAGLVNDHSKQTSLAKIKDVLVEEMGKCQLLCRNCDHRKTHNYPARA